MHTFIFSELVVGKPYKIQHFKSNSNKVIIEKGKPIVFVAEKTVFKLVLPAVPNSVGITVTVEEMCVVNCKNYYFVVK